MTSQEMAGAFEAEFERRKFVGGLLLAFIRFLRQLDALDGKYADLDALLLDYPIQATTAAGKTANTLIVSRKRSEGRPGTISLRPFYDDAERFFREGHKRFDYPNCAPHATQAWRDYRHWLDALIGMNRSQVERVERHVIEFVLAKLPSHEIDASGMLPLEQRFVRLLRNFDMAADKGERPGAAFQGIVYAYIRADAPHLHLEVAKVGAGSKRLQRVGDIDGWEGERLVLSAEVKSYAFLAKHSRGIAAFQQQVMERRAMGIVAALSFADAARADILGQGLRTVDLDDLARLVELWDPLKQRAAVRCIHVLRSSR